MEPQYARGEIVTYLAALDPGRGKVFGDLPEANNKAAFYRFVDAVRAREPYRSAARVFWIRPCDMNGTRPGMGLGQDPWRTASQLRRTPISMSTGPASRRDESASPGSTLQRLTAGWTSLRTEQWFEAQRRGTLLNAYVAARRIAPGATTDPSFLST